MFHYCGAIIKAAIADSGLACAVVVVGAFIPIDLLLLIVLLLLTMLLILL